MEEQLSGSCTVEIAAFNEFSDFITDPNKQKEYDHIIFDTAPTGAHAQNATTTICLEYVYQRKYAWGILPWATIGT